MIALCPACWREVPPHVTSCPHCGADLSSLDARDYTAKLINALSHPDDETVIRAAGILGTRDEPGAVQALLAALDRRWPSPYVAAALVRALGERDGPEAAAAIERALGHESFIVRAEAARAAQRDPRRPDGSPHRPRKG
ncbi:MAG TPA: HEAT repeat domain-containing protein [Vicinamibacterales bacterium]|nr:HEAT repeat domain-containing protein [Vicinamibacterales bacterium]